MAWLKGQTTWGTLIDKLTALACGEAADDNAVTVAVGDRWIRDIAGQNLLSSPASQDYALPQMSMRSGYWTLGSPQVSPASPALPSGGLTSVRQTSVWTSPPGGLTRWYVQLTCNTGNSVAGNYNSGNWSIYIYNADNSTMVYGNSGFVPSSSGVINMPSGAGGSITVSHPTGLIPSGSSFYRGFSTTYPGGFDFWPMWGRRAGAHTFGTAPSGASGTDWDVTSVPTAYVGQVQGSGPNGGSLVGLGIKTNAALTGALYTVSWSVSGQKFRLLPNPTYAGQVDLQIGGTIQQDPVNGNVWQQMTGVQVPSWLRPYLTPGSVTNGSLIQYWMSVKATKIVIVLNADPGQSGKMTCAWLGKFTPTYPAWDVLPWFWSPPALDYTVDNASSGMMPFFNFSLFGQKARLDASTGSRDWQTGWMRSDLNYSTDWGIAYHYSYMPTVYAPGWVGDMNNYLYTPSLVSARSNKPSSFDGKWWLYGPTFYDIAHNGQSNNNPNNATVAPNDFRGVQRGKITDGCLFIPGDGWSNGDELTDTTTGKKYFLVAADYHGIYSRIRVATNNYAGGVAILEE